MVRTNHTEPSEGKKDTIKKVVAVKKKAVTTGVWPCKINGCNKQFAREADLKRHQRTTKLHSMPGFSCPQCDATFTRTDALRRHQKSRHNGIVIEPAEAGKKDAEDEARSSESQSRSRSGTPSTKGKERVVGSSQPTAPGGPSSYYRQHTATTSAYIPPRPQPISQYSHIGLPTSSTRLNSATNWGFPHPWPNNASTVGYHPVPMYYNSPHYRQNGSAIQSQPSTSPTGSGGGPNIGGDPSSTRVSRASTTSNDSTLPAIDPHLDTSTQLTAKDIAAAMAAVLKGTSVESHSSDGTPPKEIDHDYRVDITKDKSEKLPDSIGDEARNDVVSERNIGLISGTLSMDNKMDSMHGYGSVLQRPEPMEHMLTEDGEPMLNPAELLTQESLASPPPS